jgi:hypothetical protein
MKYKVQAKLNVMVEKEVIAPSLEHALAQAHKMKISDLVGIRGDTQFWTSSVKITILGVTEPVVTK